MEVFEEEEEESEEIDYVIDIREEEDIPEGQLDAVDPYLEDTTIKRIVWNVPKLVKLKMGTKLPARAPENIVYWNKCETRVESLN